MRLNRNDYMVHGFGRTYRYSRRPHRDWSRVAAWLCVGVGAVLAAGLWLAWLVGA